MSTNPRAQCYGFRIAILRNSVPQGVCVSADQKYQTAGYMRSRFFAQQIYLYHLWEANRLVYRNFSKTMTLSSQKGQIAVILPNACSVLSNSVLILISYPQGCKYVHNSFHVLRR